MAKKNVAIKYTSRDFATIKQDLVDYAKRYYPNTFRDFNEATFGALMLDTVAYVGDMLSFYLDYQANETFLSTALEYDNIIRLGKQLGYKYRSSPSSTGIATFYIIIPALTTGLGPNAAYMPRMLRGSQFQTSEGISFILNKDIDFKRSENEIVAARMDPDSGNTTHWAVKTYGEIISGRIVEQVVEVESFERFKKIELGANNVSEVLSVTDSEGHEYFEVDYLSQDVVYKALINKDKNRDYAPNLLKPMAVPRRYVVEFQRDKAVLQFGYGSDSEIKNASIADPTNLVLQVHGKNHITDQSFDPSNLIATDKFGVSPSNTSLTVRYRVNDAYNVNAAVGSVATVISPKFRFDDVASLNRATISEIITSLEINNEEPIIGDISLPSADELRRRAYDTFATQNRAVTKQDYINMVYNMPPEFGAIKRCNIIQDQDSFKRNLNLYVVSESRAGKLITTNGTIKKNLKTWLSKVKMINDTVDVLNARVVNLGIEWEAIGDLHKNKFDIVDNVNRVLQEYFLVKPDISEHFVITDIYKVLNKVPGIVDVTDVNIVKKVGSAYATTSFNMDDYISADGRVITFPEDIIWEVRYPDSDIKGTLKGTI